MSLAPGVSHTGSSPQTPVLYSYARHPGFAIYIKYFTPLPVGSGVSWWACLAVRLSVCLCVCPQAYLWKYTSDLHQIFAHYAVACSFSGSIVIHYVFPILWMARAGLRRRRASVQIAAATLSGNSPRETVHIHHASVHQSAKFVAAIFTVASVTASLAESNGSLPTEVYDSRHVQADCQEPGSAPEPYAW